LVTDTSSSTPAPGQRGAERSSGSALDTALRRARWTIFWERLWPALATLATAAGLFLTISWLGLWLWLAPLGRAAADFPQLDHPTGNVGHRRFAEGAAQQVARALVVDDAALFVPGRDQVC
jgi:hypothetical protein